MPQPLLYADPVFLEHDTGRAHPESRERLRHLYDYLERQPVLGRFTQSAFRPIRRDELTRVHTASYINALERLASAGGGHIEADTVISRRSFEVAAHAAGAALTAVDAVLTSDVRRASCLIRPPGHHALPNGAMGFCLFNNIALAAEHARFHHGVDRLLIVDWDVHHGNGTQDVYYDVEPVAFFSVHRFPFYPGTGDANETGSGPGLGTKFNLPLPFGTGRAEYLSRFERMLTDAVARSRPELILISAGFDAHWADPIGSLGLETEDFATMTRLVIEAANQACQGRLISLLEGGYKLEALAECVEAHLVELANAGR